MSGNNATVDPATTTVGDKPAREMYPIWAFILVECLYIAVFFAAMAIIYKVGVLKDDDDAVTIHHKLHADMIEKQEEKFVEEQQENLAEAQRRKK